MKMKNLLIMMLVMGCLAAVSFGQGQNGCNGGKRNGIYYTDCWADAADDWQRLQAAIDAIVANNGSSNTGSGKLIFNEARYDISDTLKVNSMMILEGTAVNTADSSQSSTIRLTAQNKSVFLINGGVSEVSIRDLGLLATAKTGTVGIEAMNENHASCNNCVSAKVQLSNLRISGFGRGIYAHTYNNDGVWQFDSVKLDHTTFENCSTALEIDVFDSGWHVSNLSLNVPEGGYGIKVIRGGYMSFNLIVGNGTKEQPNPNNPPTNKSETYFYIREHGNLSIQNSAHEGFKRGIDIDGTDSTSKTNAIVLLNNVVELYQIKNATVVSMGNNYGNNWAVAKPKVLNDSDVFSLGDRFCYPGSSYCADSRFDVIYNTSGPSPSVQTFTNRADADKAFAKLQNSTPNKVLLELGTYNDQYEFKYSFKRDGNGWLSVEGSYPDPYRGFVFNGPIKLQSYNQNTLPTGTPANGSMAYCANCAPNTSPCTATGNGALAVVVNGQWVCK